VVGTKLGTLFPCRSDRSLANCLRGTPAPPPCTCTWSRAEKNLKIPEVDEILADTKGRYRVLFELLAGSVSVMVGLCCSFLSATPQIQGFHVAGKGGRHLRSPPIPEPFSQPLRGSRPPAGSYCKRSRKRRAGAFWKPVPRVECCERDNGGGREGRKLAEAENTYGLPFRPVPNIGLDTAGWGVSILIRPDTRKRHREFSHAIALAPDDPELDNLRDEPRFRELILAK